jgi:glycosyltransferase involved in cell wall biosynthesis
LIDYDQDIVFSVITPTYNRGNTLFRVYESLLLQTFKNFEWIVVDDGSIDDTDEIVSSWINDNFLVIRYFKQENFGKSTAVKNGIDVAIGKYSLILDSDDACTPDALKLMFSSWEDIPNHDKDNFVGVTGLCNDQNGDLVGSKFKDDVLDSDALEIKYRYKAQGEMWGFLRTDVLKDIKQPAIDGEFIPEGVWWSLIAKKYKTRYINKIVRIYYVDDKHSVNQLSQVSDPYKHCKGYAHWHRTILNEEINWFWYAPIKFFKSGVHYSRFSFLCGLGVVEQYKALTNKKSVFLWILLCIIGKLVSLRDSVGRNV